jgi:putative PIN family toxin of toxin-antitoxin system
VLRVTSDTNVIVSALNFPGNPSRILNLAEAGEIRLVSKRVLLRPKFGWFQDRVDAAIRQIAGFAEHVEPKQRIDIVVDDPTDNRILECAAASSSDYLVTGDNHLLKVRQYHGSRSCRRWSPSRFSRNGGANASRGSIKRSRKLFGCHHRISIPQRQFGHNTPIPRNGPTTHSACPRAEAPAQQAHMKSPESAVRHNQSRPHRTNLLTERPRNRVCRGAHWNSR